MNVSKKMVEKVLQCFIDENESLREDMSSLKESIGILLENVADLNEMLEDIQEFAESTDDEKTLELIRLRNVIKMLEGDVLKAEKDEEE